MAEEAVNHPKHYNLHPSGVECIDIVEHMNFCLGNAVKYIWRASLKGKQLEDLKKAQFYINREIERLENQVLKEVDNDEERKKVIDNIGEILAKDDSKLSVDFNNAMQKLSEREGSSVIDLTNITEEELKNVPV